MRWPSDIKEARRLQKELSKDIRIEPLKGPLRTIAGADAAFHEGKVIGAVSVFSLNELNLIEETYVIDKLSFPYIPGLLSFREGPAILKAIKRLSKKPDLLLFDGHGICHPAGLGIASHMGVLLNIPTIGCAKSILAGSYREPGPLKGSWSYIYINGEIKGFALRTRDNTRPLFVSPGHLVDFEDALRIVLNCCKGYRIPEPLRRADALSRILRKRLHG